MIVYNKCNLPLIVKITGKQIKSSKMLVNHHKIQLGKFQEAKIHYESK